MEQNVSISNNPACLGGNKTVTLAAPAWPIAGEQEEKWMSEVVRSGKWSWLGVHERAFTDAYAAFIGTKHCLAMANGTVTIQCALQACGVVPGDEVIVPGLTWVATAQAALDVGANVVLVDIDAETLCIDPEAVRAAVTPKTKAIIPVHLYGCMCDMDAIMAIADEYNLKVIEDVAHQHGSAWRGVCAGAIGDAGSFSFQQSKILTSGEGGAVTCNDDDVFSTCFALKQVGWTADLNAEPQADDAPVLVRGNKYGHNYRMTEMQAVLLRGGLSRLADQNDVRERNVAFLTSELSRIGGPLRAARRDPRITKQAYYCMTLVFDPAKADGLNRDHYLRALANEGITFDTTYDAVYNNTLLNLYDNTSPVPFRDSAAIQNYGELELPGVEQAVQQTAVVLAQTHLLGDEAYMRQIVEAVDKINNNLADIKCHFEKEEAAI